MAEKPSLGGQVEAWLRQGAKDLHNAVVPAFPESQRGVEEQGTPLSPTSQMVTADLQAEKGGYDAKVAKYAEQGKERQKEPEMER